MVQPSLPYKTSGKTITLTTWTFASETMSLLFHTKSRFVRRVLGFKRKAQGLRVHKTNVEDPWGWPSYPGQCFCGCQLYIFCTHFICGSSLKCIYKYTEIEHLHSSLGFCRNYQKRGTSLVAQAVKSLPAIQETQVRPLGQEDALE